MDNERDITGIEISSSWLQKTGFEPNNDDITQNGEVWKKDRFLLESDSTHGAWCFSISGTLFGISIKWVHQLQNLMALIKDVEESANTAP